jgi:predicted alpha/beta hydrolase family esterase
MSDYCTRLIVPGLQGSGERHWQTWWQSKDRNAVQVSQDDWSTPDLNSWSNKLTQAVDESQGDVWLVAHSFGCLASLQVAPQRSDRIRGVFLVAPADPEKFSAPHLLHQSDLPFPSILVASRTDPWLNFDKAKSWAKSLGSQFVDLGDAGHINAESGFGAWQDGFDLFGKFKREVIAARIFGSLI